MFLLAELNQRTQFLSPYLLSISSSIINSLTHHKPFLFNKSSQIFIQWHRIITLIALSTCSFQRIILNLLNFGFQLFCFKILCFQLLLLHGLSDFLHFVKTIVFDFIVEAFVVIFVAIVIILCVLSFLISRWYVLRRSIISHSRSWSFARKTWGAISISCIRDLLLYFLFHDIWSKLFIFNQSWRGPLTIH